jgi:S1-C subfamily serine protease
VEQQRFRNADFAVSDRDGGLARGSRAAVGFYRRLLNNELLPIAFPNVGLMEKIVIATSEIAEVVPSAEPSPRLEPKLPPPVPVWAKAALLPLVFVLPILCVVTLVLRVAMRGLPPRTRYAWLAFLTSLLIVSGIVTSLAAVLAVAFVPLPAIVSGSLTELDAKSIFPQLPAGSPMSAKEISEQLKPLVAVISPARRTWFTKNELPSAGFGAGVLLQAGPQGYLILTARHVIDESLMSKSASRALVAMASGTWSGADILARHQGLDLSLLWVSRESGAGQFVQPVKQGNSISEGENVFVIGHPQGLRFTLSTGIISRSDKEILQISAPVSPGNSGGPVFDDRGNLLGIVTSMVDRNMSPNAENLNFAVRADAVLQTAGWEFTGDGRKRLADFVNASRQQR